MNFKQSLIDTFFHPLKYQDVLKNIGENNFHPIQYISSNVLAKYGIPLDLFGPNVYNLTNLNSESNDQNTKMLIGGGTDSKKNEEIHFELPSSIYDNENNENNEN